MPLEICCDRWDSIVSKENEMNGKICGDKVWMQCSSPRALHFDNAIKLPNSTHQFSCLYIPSKLAHCCEVHTYQI